MPLKEAKKGIKELLKAERKDELIEKLNACFKDKELEEEFEDKVPENYSDDTLQGEEFVPIESGKYLVSNLGRIKFNDTTNNKQPVIPQCQDSKWNWYLDDTKFKEIYKDFDGKLASNVIIYEYFMKKTDWLQKEKAEIQEIYPNCELQLHHICKNGDNRIDNMIYLPEYIHSEVH